VHARPTVLLEGFFLILTPESVRKSNQVRLPFGEGKTSPVAVEDVSRVLAALLVNPQPHIGRIYHLTGPQGLGLPGLAKFSGHLKGAFALGDRSDAGCIVGDLGD
jgi:uncharacterized protein YbjT (DUF2867 family)